MRSLHSILALSLSAIATTCAPAAIISVVGLYDEQGIQTNVVDSSAPGGTTVAAFAPLVASAFARGTGGVINFDQFGDTTAFLATFQVGYGDRQSFSFTTSRACNITQVATSGDATPISDAAGTTGMGGVLQMFARTGIDAHPDFSLAIVNPSSARLSQIGFTILSRGNAAYPQTVSITASFTGGGTQMLIDSIAGTKGTDDTFYGFTAPEGEFISNLFFDSGSTDGSDGRVIIDDFGFVAVPEPGSAVLVLCGGAGLWGLRRRRG